MSGITKAFRSLVDGKSSPTSEPPKAQDNKAGHRHFEKVTPGPQPKPGSDRSGAVTVNALSSASPATPTPKGPLSLSWVAKNLIGIIAQPPQGEAREGQMQTVTPGKKLNMMLDQLGKLQPPSGQEAARAEFNSKLKSELQDAIGKLQPDAFAMLSAAVRADTAKEMLRSESWAIASSHFVPPAKLHILDVVATVLAEHQAENAKLELEAYRSALESLGQLQSGNEHESLIALETVARQRSLAMEALALQGLTGPEAEKQLTDLEATAGSTSRAAEAATPLIKPLRALMARLDRTDPEHREVHAKMTDVATLMDRLISAHPAKEGATVDDKRDGKREVSALPARTAGTRDAAAKEAIEHVFSLALCPDEKVIVNVRHDAFSPEATTFMASNLNGKNLTTKDWQGKQQKSVHEEMMRDMAALTDEYGSDFLGENGERVPKQFLRDAIGTEMLDASGQPYFTKEQRDGTIKGSALVQFRADAGSDKRAFQLMMLMSQAVQSLISDLIVSDKGPGTPLVTEGGIPVTIPLRASNAKLSYQCSTPAQGGPSKVRAYGFFPNLTGAPPREPLMPADSKQVRLTGDEPIPNLEMLDPRKSFFTYTMDITIGDDGVPTLDKPVSYSYRLAEGDGE